MSDIVFSASANSEEDIFVMDRDGANIRRLTHSSGPGGTNRTPEWSPDRTRIVFQSSRDGEINLYLLVVATGEVRRLESSGTGYRHPSWSPTGDAIICVGERNGVSTLIIVTVDATGERFIAPKIAAGRNLFNPCWIPGSDSKIAFVVQGNNHEPDALWTLTLDDGRSEKIGPAGYSIFEFDYSPDGRSIVFDAKVSAISPLGDWQIFVMEGHGSDVRCLTEGQAMSSRPKWLHDGNTIVFHSNRFGDRYEQPNIDAPLEDWFIWWNQFEICTMGADGTNVRRLTKNQLRDLHPDG